MKAKIKLTPDQEILLFEFLKWACKEEPRNFSEWGEQFVLLCNIQKQFTMYVKNGELQTSSNEAWAIQNYFAAYVDEIYSKRLGEPLFNECRDLFVIINNDLYASKHHPFIFIPSSYYYIPPKPITVNPFDSPEDYLTT